MMYKKYINILIYRLRKIQMRSQRNFLSFCIEWRNGIRSPKEKNFFFGTQNIKMDNDRTKKVLDEKKNSLINFKLR